MKREWFSAAFRALLAEEQAAPVEQHDERDALINQLRAEVKRLTAELRTCDDERITAEIERDAADEFVERMTAEWDALQARIDERKGERRKFEERPCKCPCGGWRLNHDVGVPSSPNRRFHDRRVTHGTRADRRP